MIRLYAVLFVLGLPCAARSQVFYRESLQGDLSNDRLSPTDFLLAEGSQLLLGALDGAGADGTIDRDYFSISVPAGFVLARLDLLDYNSQDFAAFLGIDAGPVFSISPEDASPDILLGWTLFGRDEVGSDLLPFMAKHGRGFTPPLAEGVYTFWAQQTGESTVWAANFVVEPVPPPGPTTAFGVGLICLVRRRRSDSV